MPDAWKLHPIAELLDHRVELYLHCGCTKLSVARPEFLLDRLGSGATVADAERRMRCRACKARPRIELTLEWAVSGGRDQRVDPPALPAWVPL